jgi:hypothetical protein
MKIPSIVADAKKLVDQATGAMEAVVGDINQFIDKINEAVRVLRSLGLSIELLNIKVVPPGAEIHLTGALELFDENRAKELIKGKEDNPILGLILQAFRAIALLKKPMSEAGFKGVKLEIGAGIPPKVNFEFLK